MIAGTGIPFSPIRQGERKEETLVRGLDRIDKRTEWSVRRRD